jgi:hypothetical protein
MKNIVVETPYALSEFIRIYKVPGGILEDDLVMTKAIEAMFEGVLFSVLELVIITNEEILKKVIEAIMVYVPDIVNVDVSEFAMHVYHVLNDIAITLMGLISRLEYNHKSLLGYSKLVSVDRYMMIISIETI